MLTGVEALVFPPACLVCEADLRQCGGQFCANCRTELTRDDSATCRRCSSPIGPHVDPDQPCLRCKGEKYAFISTVRLGPYAGILRDAILMMKQPGAESLAGRLGQLWAITRREQLMVGDPQWVIPVPLHWRRRFVRGYNQADELAIALAQELGIPCARRNLIRTSHTLMQSQTTSGTERRKNLVGRFRARKTLPGARVLLVDDVLTTGATANHAAQALLTAGAAQVRVAVLAHLAD